MKQVGALTPEQKQRFYRIRDLLQLEYNVVPSVYEVRLDKARITITARQYFDEHARFPVLDKETLRRLIVDRFGWLAPKGGKLIARVGVHQASPADQVDATYLKQAFARLGLKHSTASTDLRLTTAKVTAMSHREGAFTQNERRLWYFYLEAKRLGWARANPEAEQNDQ